MKRPSAFVYHLAAYTYTRNNSPHSCMVLLTVALYIWQGDGGEHNTTTGYGATQQEISVVLDLLDNNRWLFEVSFSRNARTCTEIGHTV